MDEHVNRGIVWAKPAPPQGVEFLCDCALITEVQFVGQPTHGEEVAVTCDQCKTVY